jgi:hypothetical protein
VGVVRLRPAAAVVVVLLLLLYARRRWQPRSWPSPAVGPAGWALAAYLLGVAGRVVSARATGGRAWPDALAQPVSIVLFAWLVARSFRLRRAAG